MRDERRVSDACLAVAGKHHSAEDFDVRDMARELTARRAEDLSAEDREVLAILLNDLRTWKLVSSHFGQHHGRALRLLDRLLAGGAP